LQAIIDQHETFVASDKLRIIDLKR